MHDNTRGRSPISSTHKMSLADFSVSEDEIFFLYLSQSFIDAQVHSHPLRCCAFRPSFFERVRVVSLFAQLGCAVKCRQRAFQGELKTRTVPPPPPQPSNSTHPHTPSQRHYGTFAAANAQPNWFVELKRGFSDAITQHMSEEGPWDM